MFVMILTRNLSPISRPRLFNCFCLRGGCINHLRSSRRSPIKAMGICVRPGLQNLDRKSAIPSKAIDDYWFVTSMHGNVPGSNYNQIVYRVLNLPIHSPNALHQKYT